MHLLALATQKGRGPKTTTPSGNLPVCPLVPVRLPGTRLRKTPAYHVADRQEGEEHPPFGGVEAVHDQRGDQDGRSRGQVDEELARLGGRLGLCAPLHGGIPLTCCDLRSRPLCAQVTHLTPFARHLATSPRRSVTLHTARHVILR